MSLCIKNHPLWRFDNDNSLEPCWRTLFGRPWNLSVEHLYLDFSGSMIERHYLREVSLWHLNKHRLYLQILAATGRNDRDQTLL